MTRIVAAAALLALSAGCGGSQQTSASSGWVDDFECLDRRAEYVLAGGFVAVESGVAVYCEDQRAILETWRVVDDQGTRKSDRHELSQVEFNELWKKLESTGWRNMSGECDNPEAGDADPIYTIDLRDHAGSVSLLCQGKGELPFPYNRLVNELDLKAAGFTQ